MSVLFLVQQCLIGLTNGALVALVALGYTMVYGIIRLINFAHGDLIMLGACLALTLVGATGFGGDGPATAGMATWLGILMLVVVCGLFCGAVNVAVDRIVYRPLRDAPKLAPLVSAIGVSFIFMNIGLFWIGPADRSFPELLPVNNLLAGDGLQFGWKDLLVVVVVVPLMLALMLLVKSTRLGKAMRAVSQDATAAALVGVDVDRVITATFFLGGFLGGAASVIYGLYINTIGFQMGFQNGLYAFTAAVLGGIGSIPGAVVGGLLIGLVRSLSTAYVGERWAGAIVFAILIVILVFRPEGLLGRRTKEKV
ncbi:MAG: branched-chain amino acid ABC transporter permease [Planctomycetia bacterium]